MAINLLLVMVPLQHDVLGYYFYELQIPGLPGQLADIVNFLLLFIGPCLLVNYLLIFRGDRYETIVDRYPSHQGKLFLTYFIISLMLPMVLIVVGMIWVRI